jgi:hypothetical protein
MVWYSIKRILKISKGNIILLTSVYRRKRMPYETFVNEHDTERSKAINISVQF